MPLIIHNVSSMTRFECAPERRFDGIGHAQEAKVGRVRPIYRSLGVRAEQAFSRNVEQVLVAAPAKAVIGLAQARVGPGVTLAPQPDEISVGVGNVLDQDDRGRGMGLRAGS